jgi:hypothetical protein
MTLNGNVNRTRWSEYLLVYETYLIRDHHNVVVSFRLAASPSPSPSRISFKKRTHGLYDAHGA